MTAPSRDASLSQAIALAAAGDWLAVQAIGARLGPERVPVRAALVLAEAELRVGDPAIAREYARGAAAPDQAGDPAARRLALNLLGAAHFELGDLDEAEEAFAAARDLATAEHDHLMFARTTNNLGTIANLRGQHEVAMGLYRLALPAFQRTGTVAGLAEVHHNLAITYRDVGLIDDADQAEIRALEYAGQVGARRLRTMALVGRAELRLRQGDVAVARAWARSAAVEYAVLPDPVGEADALRVVAAAELAMGALAQARDPAFRAVELARDHGSALVEAEALEVRARYHLAIGLRVPAGEDASAALALYQRLGDSRAARAVEDWISGPLATSSVDSPA